jgi:ribosomal protein L16 Arg81 hydroxylase
MNAASLVPMRCLVVIACLAALGAPAQFAQSQPAPEPSSSSTAAAPTPGETILADVKAAKFTDRAALREKLVVAEARFGEKLQEWEARKNALPKDEKAEADEIFVRLAQNREVLRQKITQVGYATKETWKSATSELALALQDTISTHQQLKARFAPTP